MKKIAIINCLQANNVCTGAACLRAFYERKASFAAYGSEPLKLVGFMRCNGCQKDFFKDPGMLEKIKCLMKMQPDAVHFGICTWQGKVECEQITKLISYLEEKHIKVIRGTH